MSSHDALTYMFHHVAFPPKLPQNNDHNIEHEVAIVQKLLICAHQLQELQKDTPNYNFWAKLCKSLDAFATLHQQGFLERNVLKNLLRRLQVRDHLALYVAAQNSGLIFCRDTESEIRIEAFEAAPPSSEVLEAEGPLTWAFPSWVVKLSAETLCEPSFLDQLAEQLEKLSSEPVAEFAATSLKASSFAIETRDIVSPSLVLDQLMALFEANGHAISPVLLHKNVRDDVCWARGSQNPWRRSPGWLVLRVAIQRALLLGFGEAEGRLHYKLLNSVFLSQILSDMCESDTFLPDSLHFVKAKTARRLFKLEKTRREYSMLQLDAFDQLFASLQKTLKHRFDVAQRALETTWSEIRSSSRKHIPQLQPRAREQDTHLTLRNSRHSIMEALQANVEANDRYTVSSNDSSSFGVLPRLVGKQIFISDPKVETILDLSSFESWVSEDLESFVRAEEPLDICAELAEKIDQYLGKAKLTYCDCPEQNSIMILTVLELWVSMDKAAIEAIPILSAYRPFLAVGLFDVLHLSTQDDFRRLRGVECYLKYRLDNSSPEYSTAFTDPNPSCFAVRFFDQSSAMKDKYEEIIEHGRKMRQLKEEEWRVRTSEYENLAEKIRRMTCQRIVIEYPGLLPKIVHDRRCEKCSLQKVLEQMTIRTFEDPLPSNLSHAKSVVFELMAPKVFTIYRRISWKVRTSLFLANLVPCGVPEVLLYSYSELLQFQDLQKPSLTLGSRTKSFLTTHYATNRLPISIDKVCLHNPLRFALWDPSTSQWVATLFNDFRQFSCAHLCTLPLPQKSSWARSSLRKLLAPIGSGLTANEIVANQTRCGADLSVFEYSAACALRSYPLLQWSALLRELASVDLSFSSEVTYLLIQQLSLQVGPAVDNSNHARAYHQDLINPDFGMRIIQQAVDRLHLISKNWREFFQADSLLTILLQILTFSQSPVVNVAGMDALRQARTIFIDWVRALKAEAYCASDTETYQRRSSDLCLAALLCRRTFSLEFRSREFFSSDALACYLECSIALHDNKKSIEVSNTHSIQTAYLRDLKLACQMWDLVYDSFRACSSSLTRAINQLWPGDQDILCDETTTWDFCGPTSMRWVSAHVIPVGGGAAQDWFYDLIEGKLLIDGRGMTALPSEYTETKTFQDLFGQRAYIAYHSPFRGMSYTLANPVEGNEIHLGFRRGQLVVRLRKGPELQELLPASIFRGGSAMTCDLPLLLIWDHMHWINLSTGVIEIRSSAFPFRSDTRDWRLHFTLHESSEPSRAFCGDLLVVEPGSESFERLAQILTPFEERERLLVFQPRDDGISVSMPRLDLTFFVNSQGLLQSRELNAVVDRDQDIGCLYGLESKLVLRDTLNAHERSFLVPAVLQTAPMKVKRKGKHVNVYVKPSGISCRFTINDVLKRIEPYVCC